MRIVPYKDKDGNEKWNLVSYKNDYGVPVIISAKYEDGFSLNDKIEFVTEGNIISRKEWTINSDNFEFQLAFTEEEAKKLSVSRYDFSFKQYREKEHGESELLDTIIDGQIIIKRTVLWQD